MTIPDLHPVGTILRMDISDLARNKLSRYWKRVNEVAKTLVVNGVSCHPSFAGSSDSNHPRVPLYRVREGQFQFCSGQFVN